jgi:uncharacterized protein YhfF
MVLNINPVQVMTNCAHEEKDTNDQWDDCLCQELLSALLQLVMQGQSSGRNGELLLCASLVVAMMNRVTIM